MEPIGQKPPSENPLHSRSSLSFEFLIHLMDLSKRASPGALLSISLQASTLAKALSSESSQLVLFDFPSPEDRTRLAKLLTDAADGKARPTIVLNIQKEEGRLLWTFHGGDKSSLTFSSALVLSRPSTIRLEKEMVRQEKSLSGDVLENALPIASARLGETISLEDKIEIKGAVRSFGASTIFSTGPVAVWPSFNSERTIELTIRWVTEEEPDHRLNPPLRSSPSEIAFSLEIPWKGESSESKTDKRVHLSGTFGKGTVTLFGRNLPDDFMNHFHLREEMMSESLKVFPGVALSVRLGEGRDRPRRGEEPL